MTIDPNTGLPELPENMFWRVRQTNEIWISPGAYTVVEIVDRHTYTTPGRTKTFWGIFPYGHTEPFTEMFETVLIAEDVWDSNRPITEENYQWGFGVDKNGNRFYLVPPEKVTPAQILEAAEKAFGRYEAELTSKKLLGDYPPKKLPNV